MAGIRIGAPNRKRTSAVLVENNPINRNRNGSGDWRGNAHMMIDHRREIARGKIKEIVFKPETMLIVRIHTAEEIDRETKDFRDDRRIYQVHGWVIPGNGFFTQRSGYLPNPEWYQHYAIPSGLLNSGESLHLELYRTKSKSDPGPSTGNVLVGRAQIKLPEKLNREECRRHGLVKPGGSADGALHIKFFLMTKEDFNDGYA